MGVRAEPGERTVEWERQVAFQGLSFSFSFCFSCTCVCEEMVSCGQARRAFKLKAGERGVYAQHTTLPAGGGGEKQATRDLQDKRKEETKRTELEGKK